MVFDETCRQKVELVNTLVEMAKDDPNYKSISKEVTKLIYFLEMLPETARGACVLAVYAGESNLTGNNDSNFGFGPDSYEYTEKYVDGGLDLREDYGTKDYHNVYANYFNERIKPKQKLMGGNTTAKVSSKSSLD